jgi:EAL domain-containing protein (putative c-di-GMP-specific phosphodiesterase class I)
MSRSSGGIPSAAHAAGMTVVAEGVETREQLRLMHELGADEVQGYFFSRPLPASECEPFLLGRCDVARGGTASSAALA